MHDYSAMECPFNSAKTPAYYGSYLAVDQLLGLQTPLSLIEGKLHAHDEMLFIIIHQTYELWFKQILHELHACCEVLQQPSADDNGPDMNVVVHRLKRIVEIWKLLNHQVDVLETMTPLDFLDFRSSLEGASGFQSIQFRQIEATLGLRMENRFRPDYYKHTEIGGFSQADYNVIVEAEKTTTLLQLVEAGQNAVLRNHSGRAGMKRHPIRRTPLRRRLRERTEQLNPASGTATGSYTRRVFPSAMRRKTC